MNPESSKGEETIFAEALSLPAVERAAYLDQTTEGRPELRRRVEALLGSYRSGEFLEHAAAEQLRPPATLTEKAGDILGRYKLLEQIGEGGCGQVYVAEQSEPVRRRVALKIIKLGMDTRSIIARFEAERQALAMMDHPNIAKVFDAGATETGRPYFVMELVRGMKITEFCDEAKLSPRSRLELFIQVCQAIQHAHQKGIIHRDIKPSNILVSMNDGVPVPKVIDFGIAKAINGLQLTDKTVYTAFEQFIGTPAYMSPEQAVITNVDVDTRSDIYALGVLLYELLTGKTPFDATELLAVGLDEMRRTIREQEPPRPSTRLSTLPGQELSTTALRRGLDAPRLVSELRGDLDWIVMKALEKDRARRYETANGLASDIRRHLNNEPVVACPPSQVYRFKKTLRRNKLAFAAATAVTVALLLGLILSAWQADRAKTERDSAEAVLKFFQDHILAAGRPEGRDGGLGKDVSLRKAIDAAEPHISAGFQNRPLVEAAIRQTLGESYWHLAEPNLAIQQLERALTLRLEHLGFEHDQTLRSMNELANAYRDVGKVEEARALYERILNLRKRRLGLHHPETLQSMNNLAIAYRDTGKPDQALGLLEETYRLTKARLGTNHSDTLRSMNNLAVVCEDAGKFDRSMLLCEEAFALKMATFGSNHLNTLLSMSNLAETYAVGGQFDRALPLFEQTLEGRRTKLGPDHPDTLYSMNNLAGASRHAGKLDQALALHDLAIKLAKTRLGTNHPNTLRFMKAMAPAYRLAGRVNELVTLYREHLSHQSGDVLVIKIELGRLLLQSSQDGRSDPRHRQELAAEGHQLLDEVLVGARKRYPNDPLKLARRLQEIAQIRHRNGQYAEAEDLYREIIELRRPRVSAEHGAMLEAKAGLGHLFSDWAWAERTNMAMPKVAAGPSSNPQPSNVQSQPSAFIRAREAERLLREVLAVRLRNATSFWRTADLKSRLGGALVAVAITDFELDPASCHAKLSEAETLLFEGREQLAKSIVDERYERDALERLVRLYQAWNKPDKRSEWQEKLDLFDRKWSPGEPVIVNTSQANAEAK